MKTNELFEKIDCKKDNLARRVLNTCDKVAKITAEEIEKGVSFESLQSIGVPIYNYQTQVTIHGKLPRITSETVGNYKSLILNKNGTIGVKYVAIDFIKKELMGKVVRVSGSRWRVNSSSSGFQLVASFKNEEREKAVEFAKKHANLCNLIYGAFYGQTLPWGAGFLIIFDVGAIPQENLWEFITGITGLNEQTFPLALEDEKKRQSEQEERWKKQDEERKKANLEKFKKLSLHLKEENKLKQPVKEGIIGIKCDGKVLVLKIEGKRYLNLTSNLSGWTKFKDFPWPKALSQGRIYQLPSNLTL